MIDIDRSDQGGEFGWQFQIASGIILALNNINKAKSINIEGPQQDVEITLNDGRKILGQAKAYSGNDAEEESAKTGWSIKLKSGIVGLFENFISDPVNLDCKYITNFPYPLGKNKGGKTNFSPKYYGDLFGQDLTAKQVEILKKMMRDSVDKQIQDLNQDDFDDFFSRFINHLTIRTSSFTNIRGSRRFAALDNKIKDFLERNEFHSSYTRLREQWMSKGLANGSEPFAMERIDFLFSIVLVDGTFSKNELFGRKIRDKKISDLYDRFREIVEENVLEGDFNRSLTADILEYFNIKSTDDYFYDDEEAEEFTNYYLKKYVSYFEIDNLSAAEQKGLTRFVIARFLEDQDVIARLCKEGGLKNVD